MSKIAAPHPADSAYAGSSDIGPLHATRPSIKAYEAVNGYVATLAETLLVPSSPVGNLRLDGSWLTGFAVLAPGAAENSSDVDIILSLREGLKVNEETLAWVHDLTGATPGSLVVTRRWGREQRRALLSSKLDLPSCDASSAVKVDLWLTESPFTTVSPYWQHLFLPEEIAWQGKLRSATRFISRLEGTPYRGAYNEFKAVVVYEARWRLLAALGMRLLGAGDPLASIAMDEVPDIAVADPAVLLLARRWASGEDDADHWLDKPIYLHPVEAEEALSMMDPDLVTDPDPPKWVSIAQSIRERACKAAQR